MLFCQCKKVEESDSSSSSSGRSKRPNVKTVMEYCYEPEMEEVSFQNIYVEIDETCNNKPQR